MDLFMLGFSVGLGLTALLVILSARCRFRWHKWTAWQWDGKGAGQFRTCRECGLTDIQLFRDGATGLTVSMSRPAEANKATEERG